jgi:phosphoribosyl 1,2-cyclic phosphodiesterase
VSFTYCVLASGSSGNSLWLKAGDVELLIDAGISARRIQRCLCDLGTSLSSVRAVVVTHGHADHVGGVATLARRHDLEVWCTRETALPPRTPQELRRELPRSGTVRLGQLLVETVPTPHDAPGSVAVCVDDGASRLAVITDLGVATPAVLALARGCQGLVLEANHDLAMLEGGPYPWYLKQRIKGERGHFSNAQSEGLLRAAHHPGLRHLTLAHLSHENNTPDLARAAVEPALEQLASAAALVVASRLEASAPVTLPSPVRPRQLPLFGRA